MIEPVTAVGARPTLEASDFQLHGHPDTAVDPTTQQEFEAMLNADDLRVAQVENTQAAVDLRPDNAWVLQPGPAEAPPPPTIGEVVSAELQDLRQGWQDLRADIVTAFEGDGMTIENLMKLQMEVQHSGIMVQMLLNEVSAFNQEVSKLMHAN